MLMLTIGEIIGMSHETRYTSDGRPVLCHRPHLAVITAVNSFHAATGTIHGMRPYVVEDRHEPDHRRYLWSSRCGQLWLRVSASGVCHGTPVGPEVSPFCHRCLTCQRLADEEAYGRELRQTLQEVGGP
jgi:hypothetical protein